MIITPKAIKPNRCKHCRVRMPDDKARHVLHDDCIDPWLAAERVKKERKQAAKQRAERRVDAVKRETLKSKADWAREAQTAVNRVARLRDIHAGHGCISCGAAYQGRFGGAFDGGHYRSVGAAPHLRFYLPQISLQCVKCNRYLGGNATEARKGLIARHGLERVEAIEAMQGDGKWSIPYLQRLKKIMTRMAGRIEKRIAAKGLV